MYSTSNIYLADNLFNRVTQKVHLTCVIGVFELCDSFEFVRLLSGLLALQLLVLLELAPS